MTAQLLPIQNQAFDIDRLNNTDNGAAITLAAQAAGTVTYGPAYCPKRAMRVIINITANSLVTGLTVTILGYDPASLASGTNTWSILATTAQTGTGIVQLLVCPEITAASNSIAQTYMPPFFEITALAAGAGSVTATISTQYLG